MRSAAGGLREPEADRLRGAGAGRGGRPPDRGPWSLGWCPRRADAHRMAWFFRAIEQADGRWACSHGGAVFDQHDELPDALVHLRDIAATMSPAELFVHHLDGDVKNIGSV